MDHLQQHRVRLPVSEVLYRMNCLIEITALASEDLDVTLVGKEGITIRSVFIFEHRPMGNVWIGKCYQLHRALKSHAKIGIEMPGIVC